MSGVASSLPEPEIYFDPPGKCYYMRDDLGEFISISESSLKRELRIQGYCPDVEKAELVSEMDEIISKIQKSKNVHYAGPLAGHKTGLLNFQGRRVLVTESPTIIAPVEGSWATWQQYLHRLLVPPPELDPDGKIGIQQLKVLFSWLKVSMVCLRQGTRRPGQVLVLAGAPSCGKSFLQNYLTKMLGGRSSKPYQYMTAGTQFNSELFHAEHLMIEDESASFDYRTRVKMGAMLKGFVANEDQRCHAKNRQALTLRPFWRVSMTLNDDQESFMVMPPIEGVADKVTLLRAFPGPMPMPTETLEQWGAFRGLLDAELPALVHYILHEWQVPEEMKCQRYGVTHYHHPELLQMMSALAPETRLLELIDSVLFPKGAQLWSTWEGKSSELEAELCAPSSAVAHEARKLLLYNTACGQYLGRLEKIHPERVKSRRVKGITLWEIEPPAKISA